MKVARRKTDEAALLATAVLHADRTPHSRSLADADRAGVACGRLRRRGVRTTWLGSRRALGARGRRRMNYFIAAIPLTLGLMLGMLFLLEFGRRLARRTLAASGGNAQTSPLDSAVFGLLGLMLAFTFSGGGTLFDPRRAQIVEETNDLGTAWLRLDLLPGNAQPALRDLFRRYVDSRLEIYSHLQDVEATQAELRRTNELQAEIWTSAVTACGEKKD